MKFREMLHQMELEEQLYMFLKTEKSRRVIELR